MRILPGLCNGPGGGRDRRGLTWTSRPAAKGEPLQKETTEG